MSKITGYFYPKLRLRVKSFSKLLYLVPYYILQKTLRVAMANFNFGAFFLQKRSPSVERTKKSLPTNTKFQNGCHPPLGLSSECSSTLNRSNGVTFINSDTPRICCATRFSRRAFVRSICRRRRQRNLQNCLLKRCTTQTCPEGFRKPSSATPTSTLTAASGFDLVSMLLNIFYIPSGEK
jgi:hypothetical protein